MTTGTRQLALIRRRRFELQQFTQGAGSGLMERETQRARLLQAGIGVASWTEGDPLEAVVMEVEGWRRRARLRVR